MKTKALPFKEKNRRTILRNLSEIYYALLERKVLVSLEKYNKDFRLYTTGENFFAIAHRALFSDILTHSIKVLDTDERSATFWSILDSNRELIEKMQSYSQKKTEYLKTLARKLKNFRNKTHFHIDVKVVSGRDEILNKQEIDPTKYFESLNYVWSLLNELYKFLFKDNFSDELELDKIYDGKDAIRLLDFAEKNKMI